MTTKVAVGERVRAATINEMIDDIDGTGIRLAVPASVSGAGVSVNAVGVVSFTAATSVIMNGCFTSRYRSYKVVAESTGAAGATVAVQLRVGGVSAATNYDKTDLVARNSTVTSSTALAQTSWIVQPISNTLAFWDMDLAGPALTSPTRGVSRAGVHANPAVVSVSNGLVQAFLTHRDSTAYDGLEITFSTAQTGTIRIYGYA